MPAKAPTGRRGRFGFMDDDDPELSSVVRRYAERTGKSHDELMRDEVTQRMRNPRHRLPPSLVKRYGPPADDTGGASSAPARTRASAPASSSPKGSKNRRADEVARKLGASKPTVSVPELAGGARDKLAGVGMNDGAGVVLGLIGYALTLNYLRGGTAGAKAWLRAKFLNEPAAAAGWGSGPNLGWTAPDQPDFGIPLGQRINDANRHAAPAVGTRTGRSYVQ